MKTIEIIIETPKGSNQKYHYDSRGKCFEMKKTLPLGMIFPFDFGFIPGTKGEDGDPLDVLVISEYGTFPGCKISCRIIGCIAATQSVARPRKEQIRNDRILAVSEESMIFKKVNEPKQLPEKMIEQLTSFFIQYNKLEEKIFTPIGILNSKATIALISK